MLIYLIKHTESGKSYVGQTIQPLTERVRQHFKKSAKSCPALAAAIKKYGKDAFEVTILATAQTQEELNLLEQKYILELNTVAPGGYNLEYGGSRGKDSEETIARRKQALNSQECKEKISKKSKECWANPEYRKRLSEARKAHWQTKEYREAQLAARRTPERRKKQQQIANEILIGYTKKRRKPVIAKDLVTGIERCYASAYHAQLDGFKQSEVSKCCRNPGKFTHYKHAWRFCDDQ